MNDWRIEKLEQITNAMNRCCNDSDTPAKIELIKVFYDLWKSQLLKDEHSKRSVRLDILCCHENNDNEQSFVPFVHVSVDNVVPRLSEDNNALCLSVFDRRSHPLWGLNLTQITNVTIEKFEHDEHDINTRHVVKYEIAFRYMGLVDYRLNLVIGD